MLISSIEKWSPQQAHLYFKYSRADGLLLLMTDPYNSILREDFRQISVCRERWKNIGIKARHLRRHPCYYTRHPCDNPL
jgi:hypothetical protein